MQTISPINLSAAILEKTSLGAEILWIKKVTGIDKAYSDGYSIKGDWVNSKGLANHQTGWYVCQLSKLVGYKLVYRHGKKQEIRGEFTLAEKDSIKPGFRESIEEVKEVTCVCFWLRESGEVAIKKIVPFSSDWAVPFWSLILKK